MRKDYYTTENSMNEWSKFIDANQSNIVNQSFYTRFFVKYGPETALVDLENNAIHFPSGGEISLVKAQAGAGCSKLKMYSNEQEASAYDLKIGTLTLRVKLFENRQIRNEVTLMGAHKVKNADGYVIRPMSTKQCRVKKINCSKVKKMKESIFKRKITEDFTNYKTSNGVVSSQVKRIVIPRV